MANHHLIQHVFSNFIKITSSKHIIFHRSLSTKSNIFQNVYSDENLASCISRIGGLHYHDATDNEKKKFFEIKKRDAKRAAVLVPLCYDDHQHPSILFTLRSPNLAIHKWEVCFPGGKLCDLQDDGDITKTAARETKEELGISDESIDVVGVLSPVPGKQSNTFVFPVLAKIDLTKEGDHNIEFHNKSLDEVEEVIIRPLSELVKPENWSFTHWTTGLTTPIYRDSVFNDTTRPRVWGLTSYFLFQVLSHLLPDQFKLQYSTLTRYRN